MQWVATLMFICPLLALADLEAGQDAFMRGDYQAAYREWLPLAERGDRIAQNNIGFLYDTGQGVPEDDHEAVKWYRRSADQGHAEAQQHLGDMYSDGAGVEKSDDEAAKWYRRSAEQGRAAAQLRIGFSYSLGLGVAADYVQAYAWWDLAAAQGNEKAAEMRDMTRGIMTPTQIEEAQQLSRALCGKIPKCGR